MILFVYACGNGDTASERKDGYSQPPDNPGDSLFKEVMDGHDVAMAKMVKLAGYRKEVGARIDSLQKISASAKSSFTTSLKALESDLEQAESGMNKWMDEFSIDSAQNGIEQRINYLKSEKIKVDDVKEKILSTLAKADSMLKK